MMSQTAEYALLAVVALAEQYPNSQSVGQIAKSTNVPAGYLSKVLQRLARSQLVVARRGTHGGFVLTKAPADISAFDVVNAIEPAKRRMASPTTRNSSSPDFTALISLVHSAIDSTERTLRHSTIASMVTPKNTPVRV